MSKRTLQNCSIIKQALANGKSWPDQLAGTCRGYLNQKGKQHPKCKQCHLNKVK